MFVDTIPVDGISTSHFALIAATLSFIAFQSVTTNPLNPHSLRNISSNNNALSDEYTPLILLYEHMIEYGCAFIASSNAGKYISRNVLSSITAEIDCLSLSWLFAAKCFTHAPACMLWTPSIYERANFPARYGSSEKYSKFLPHNASLLIFVPGPKMISIPWSFVCFASSSPSFFISFKFHVDAIQTAGGNAVAGYEAFKATASSSSFSLRTPWGPSANTILFNPFSFTSSVCQ